MRGQAWAGQDPTGWFMVQKLGGIRAFWDGSKLFARDGKIVLAPLDFISSLPPGVSLDGELWIGYGALPELTSILNQNLSDLWKDVKYIVFDAPTHHGTYPQRHAFASATIPHNSNRIKMIPSERCIGLEHLQSTLHTITTKKGAGVLLYHPESSYTPGRTGELLEVKDSFEEEDVTFLKCNENSYTFICEQQNGARCIVKCSGWEYLFPPSPGSILTVMHSGLYNTSRKMKSPFLVRIRHPCNLQQI
uniref:ATP-dependent DNA ligase family profile domain-containing protein n=1 Tax=Arcella intermedia TaxID=1963864 RepID=A0A6B2LF53_9EUKA